MADFLSNGIELGIISPDVLIRFRLLFAATLVGSEAGHKTLGGLSASVREHSLIYESYLKKRTNAILSDEFHPSFNLFPLLPSRKILLP